MKGFQLTSQELPELHTAHKIARGTFAREAYKINAIILLGSSWEIEEVSKALLLDDETLRGYVKKYKERGISGVLKTNYRGGICRLDEAQLHILCDELDTHVHIATDSVIAVIKQTFNVEYSTSGVTDLLHRLGYVYKNPKLTPGKINIQAQEEFLNIMKFSWRRNHLKLKCFLLMLFIQSTIRWLHTEKVKNALLRAIVAVSVSTSTGQLILRP